MGRTESSTVSPESLRKVGPDLCAGAGSQVAQLLGAGVACSREMGADMTFPPAGSWGPQYPFLPFLGEPPTGQRGSFCHGGGDGAGRGAAASPAAGAGKAQPPGQCQVSFGLGTLAGIEPYPGKL